MGATGGANDKCTGCTLCFRIGCPAILKSDELDEKTQRPKALIDASLCTGCEVCAQVCPRAIAVTDIGDWVLDCSEAGLHGTAMQQY